MPSLAAIWDARAARLVQCHTQLAGKQDQVWEVSKNLATCLALNQKFEPEP